MIKQPASDVQNIKVLHIATGGFSGVTHVVLDLIDAMSVYSNIQSFLVLRHKKNTIANLEKSKNRIEHTLRNQPIKHPILISSKPHLVTIYQIYRLCAIYQPDIIMAHGFPEHLLGRWAGWLAQIWQSNDKKPYLIQVEHASKERYRWWRLWQTRFLSKHTDAVVGVSTDVVEVLKQQNLHPKQLLAIPNGIDTQHFFCEQPIAQRDKDIIMVARFSKGKNHAVLIEALHLLKQKGITATLSLVGSGSRRHIKSIENQCQQLNLTNQVQFFGHSQQVAQLLAQHKIFVLASHHEGLSLSVIEAMAAGCVVIGSNVTGIRELICDGQDGYLFAINDAQTLASQLYTTLTQLPKHQQMVKMAQDKAMKRYDKQHMALHYHHLIHHILTKEQP